VINQNIISFEQALDLIKDEKRHLLLGNGFSIALFPDIFTYKRLLDTADFSMIPESRSLFNVFDTTDFEEIIHALKISTKVLPAFMADHHQLSQKMHEQSEAIKELLVQVIAGNHPENPSKITQEQFSSCRKFLSNFISGALPKKSQGIVYTVSYDLLLYWVVMHDNDETHNKIILNADDGFRAAEDNFDADYVVWNGYSDSQNIRYLHGGLHLFDDGYDLRKFCWERSGGIPLISQVQKALSKNQFPLFISEGSDVDKLKKIRHSHIYLQSSMKSLSKIGGNLFVYGHSLADNDDHILNLIPKSKIHRLFIGIYGDTEESKNKLLIQKAKSLPLKRKGKNNDLEIIFFDSKAAQVWDAFA